MSRAAFAAAPLVLLTVVLAPASPAQNAPWPTNGWAASAAATQGMLSAPLDSLDGELGAGRYGYVDRVFITRNGFAVFNQKYRHDYVVISRGRSSPIGCGPDACQNWRGPAEFNYMDPQVHPFYRGSEVHTLQSVTKSVSSALIGVAIRRREISGVDAPLLSFLGEYDLSKVDPRLRRATLADLLTMRTGIEWHESDRPLDSTNTTLQLEFSDDWVQFTLNQPMDADPGTKWVYNSGGSHLMSAIIRKATGRTIDKYAEQYLFGPLGIRNYHWKKDPKGLPDTEGGLFLEAEQLAKIGYLYLNDGVWNGSRILPGGWVAASVERHVPTVNAGGAGYGYQWWRVDRRGVEIWAGQGFGGQFLLVFPAQKVVAVANSWNIWGGSRPSILNGLIEAIMAATGR